MCLMGKGRLRVDLAVDFFLKPNSVHGLGSGSKLGRHELETPGLTSNAIKCETQISKLVSLLDLPL